MKKISLLIYLYIRHLHICLIILLTRKLKLKEFQNTLCDERSKEFQTTMGDYGSRIPKYNVHMKVLKMFIYMQYIICISTIFQSNV